MHRYPQLAAHFIISCSKLRQVLLERVYDMERMTLHKLECETGRGKRELLAPMVGCEARVLNIHVVQSDY